MIDYVVREYAPSDEDAVVDLAARQIAETAPHMPFEPEAVRAHLATAYARPARAVFLCWRGDTLIGWLGAGVSEAFYCSRLIADLAFIYVIPQARGGPAAVKLLRAFDAWARACGAAETYVGVSNGHEIEKTGGMLIRFGYTPVGFYLRKVEDHVQVRR